MFSGLSISSSSTSDPFPGSRMLSVLHSLSQLSNFPSDVLGLHAITSEVLAGAAFRSIISLEYVRQLTWYYRPSTLNHGILATERRFWLSVVAATPKFFGVPNATPLARRSVLPLPPGPLGRPFFGIQSRLLKSEPWKTYAAWGPILSFRIYNRLTFVLNNHTAVHELLERRPAIYSGRPMSWMFNVICGRGDAVFNISGLHPRHKIYRRLLQGGLNTQAVKEYSSILEDEMDILVRALGQMPAQFEQHIRRNATAVIMKVAFGYSVMGDDDPFISFVGGSFILALD
ncbi:cytochrome P450 [Mycena galopus ATCC 62051]|nr:cytochrome P450 [Mycena galopus ATCC 62051]